MYLKQSRQLELCLKPIAKKSEIGRRWDSLSLFAEVQTQDEGCSSGGQGAAYGVTGPDLGPVPLLG